MRNYSKSILKGIIVVLCGLKYLNLENQTVKAVGCHYSYNKKIDQENISEFKCVRLKMD